eukprot:5676168-Prymnesium_polylepis.2
MDSKSTKVQPRSHAPLPESLMVLKATSRSRSRTHARNALEKGGRPFPLPAPRVRSVLPSFVCVGLHARLSCAFRFALSMAARSQFRWALGAGTTADITAQSTAAAGVELLVDATHFIVLCNPSDLVARGADVVLSLSTLDAWAPSVTLMPPALHGSMVHRMGFGPLWLTEVFEQAQLLGMQPQPAHLLADVLHFVGVFIRAQHGSNAAAFTARMPLLTVLQKQ